MNGNLSIALDATYSLGEDLSGVGVYSREILAGLAAAHPEARFRFCYRPHRLLGSLRETLPRNARRAPLGESAGPWGADLFHGLNQRLPRHRYRRAVCTFHDLFVMTGDYSSPEFRRRFAEQARQAAARADRIIAVSAFTAGQVHELLGVETERIQVVHHGLRRLPSPPRRPETIILSVGAIQKRKNTARLVEAFEKAGAGWELVLAGAAGFGAAEVLERIGRSSCRDRIRVLGYVPDSELAFWYARAGVFAFPSLDEGFGIPVLEAMAQGIPVLTSRRAALPEVVGDAACTADPENVPELAAALDGLLRDEALRNELAARGIRRAANFTWEKAVSKTWEVYRTLLR